MDYNHVIREITLIIIPLIFAITVHEAAHAIVAKRLGDDTAERMGRTSLNPTVHIDPVGTIIMPVVLFLVSAGSFMFGYAKPVPVVASRLNNPARDMPIVALAGPVSNFIMAAIWAIIWTVLLTQTGSNKGFFVESAYRGIGLNLILFALNMLPLLPLDGGRVLMGFLPASIGRVFAQTEQYGMWILIALMFFGGNLLSTLWMSPIMNASEDLIKWLLVSPLSQLLS